MSKKNEFDFIKFIRLLIIANNKNKRIRSVNMLKSININLEIMEAMLYFWQATKDKEKVGEAYILSIADKPEMQYTYDKNFNSESVRLVLSAISNRELLNTTNKIERKFWNNNMWMLEDMGIMSIMLLPLKTLNLDDLVSEINSKTNEFDYDSVEIVFFPGHNEIYRINENKLFINFFRLGADMFEENKISIDGADLKQFIFDKMMEMNK